jgi:hypothetical protein
LPPLSWTTKRGGGSACRAFLAAASLANCTLAGGGQVKAVLVEEGLARRLQRRKQRAAGQEREDDAEHSCKRGLLARALAANGRIVAELMITPAASCRDG